MSLKNIKYSDVVNPILNYILEHCVNLDDKYLNLDPEYKKNYVTQKTFENTSIHYRIASGIVFQVTSNEVRQDFNTFLNKLGIANKLNQILPESEFIPLLLNAASFCKAHCGVYDSSLATNRHRFIFIRNNNYETYPLQGINTIKAFDTKKLLEYSLTAIASLSNIIVTQYEVYF